MTAFSKVTTVERLEALLGTAPQLILMKATSTLDEGCREVFASSPIAGFGYRDADGHPRATIVGGAPGFVQAISPTRLAFDLAASEAGPVEGGGVSFVFLVPSVGETLRLNGVVAERAGTRVAVDLQDAYVHCAKCVLRSRLWDGGRAMPASAAAAPSDGDGPLADPEVATFLAGSPFAVVSSWDAHGASDTSPKGDPPGFMRALDGRTLAIPHRKGNKRNDTFHNLLTCDELALAATVPGRDELLHLRGTGYVTDDAGLLASFALGDKPPATALVIRVESAQIVPNEAIRQSRLWDVAARQTVAAPDMNRIASQHLANNRSPGAKATMTRALSKGMAKAPPRLLRRALDAGYRIDLKGEGYSDEG